MPAPIPLDYLSPQRREPIALPWWAAPASLIPPGLLVAFIEFHKPVSRLLQIGQGAERLQGIAWIVTAALSITWLGAYVRRPRPAYVWACLTIHFAVVGLTVFPSIIVIPWFMHWLSGPGA